MKSMNLAAVTLTLFAAAVLTPASDEFRGPWNVELIQDGFPGAEGPVWSRDGYLLFSDFETERIHRYVPGQKVTVYREQSHGANGNALDRQGRLYTCEYKSRRVTRTSPDGKVEVLADRWQGKRLNAPNDIIVRADGNVYFTDPLFTPLDRRDLDFFGIYRISPGGVMDLIASKKTRPNGIALSPDGKLLYVANSDERNVSAWDLDRTGKALNERVIVPGLPGGPDGMKVDIQGNLYVTARGIQIYSPAGKHLGSIDVPGGVARNCAFGDKDFKTLYITGRTALLRVRVPVKGAIHH
jgi:gluconolactonase